MPPTKRKRVSQEVLGGLLAEAADEEVAEAELAAALEAAQAAPAEEQIGGLGDGTAMVAFHVKGTKVKQYKVVKQRGDKPLVFLYLCIRGLGETQRMMLAECGAEYTHLASPMGEAQSVSCEWRKRSPNGLTPVISGLGVPRCKPLSQSGTTIRFIAAKFGMQGETELEALRADCLYNTAKDLGGKRSEIESAKPDDMTSGAKGPAATAVKIAAMLEDMADPKDDDAALNYGQVELLKLLIDCEEAAAGCVKALSPALDAFRAAGACRPRIASYLSSPMRFPVVDSKYRYASPMKRSAFALS